MGTLILILALIGIIEVILVVFVDWNNEDIAFIMFGSGITSVITAIVFTTFILIEKETKIEPIEVYRGNTTLQITYKDSIPIDSVVVYKNK